MTTEQSDALRLPRPGIILCTEEELERCQSVYETTYINGERVTIVREGILFNDNPR